MRFKNIMFHILSFVALVAPIVYKIYTKADIYLATTEKTSFYFGLIIALGIVGLMVTNALGHLNRKFRSAIFLGALTVASTLISPLFSDLPELLPLATAGYVGYIIFSEIGIYYGKLAFAYKEQFSRERAKSKIIKKEQKKNDRLKGRY